jgi:hypothetical protein
MIAAFFNLLVHYGKIIMSKVQSRSFRAAALVCATITLSGVPAYADTVQHVDTRHAMARPQTDAECVAHAVWGEARDKPKSEYVGVTWEIRNYANMLGEPICDVVRKKFFRFQRGKSHNRSSPLIDAAVDEVLVRGLTLEQEGVDEKFKTAIQNRAPSRPRVHDKCLVYLGQINPPRGDVFYGYVPSCKPGDYK